MDLVSVPWEAFGTSAVKFLSRIRAQADMLLDRKEAT